MRLIWGLLIPVALGAATSPLEIVNVAVAQEDGGASVPSGFTHVPGETLFLSFQVQGYRPSPEQKVRLRYRVDSLDPHGTRIVETAAKDLETELSPQDKDWKPKIRAEAIIPPLAPPGAYKFSIEVEDRQTGAKAAREIPFQVRGREVEPSETLVVRNFRFFRSEEATEALTKAAYRPGSGVWARFDITGYKFGPGNQVDVSYGIAVLNEAGKALLSEAEATSERSQSFYPNPYVPFSLGFTLQPDIHPGEYTIVVTARDGIGKQEYETRQTFAVE